jgi:PKD repeat protein
MRYLIHISVTILLHLTVNSQEKNVLFIGNSMTYYNNMPSILQQIALEHDQQISYHLHAPGGTGFINHVADNSLFEAIRNNSFDIIIMQPGTAESAGASSSISLTAQRGKQLLDSIRKYNTCFKAFLYQIPYGVINESSYSNYFAIQSKIEDSIRRLADLMEIPMIPAGECQSAYYSNHPNLLLNSTYNDVHPSYEGSYLVASAMYTAVFLDSVTGTNYAPNISSSNLALFQQIVDSVVFTHTNSWRLDTFQLTANFNYIQNENTVHLTNSSQYYDSLLWEFSDGFTSIQQNPSHTFLQNGAYEIELTVYKNGCEKKALKTIQIFTLEIDKILSNDILVRPNPFTDFIFIQNKMNFDRIEIRNAKGEKIIEEISSGSMDKIDVRSLSQGNYFLLLYFKNDLMKTCHLIKN